MTPSVQTFLASALLLAFASFGLRTTTESAYTNAAPFTPPVATNGAVPPPVVVGQEHLQVAQDLKNSLNLRFPADFVRDNLADYTFKNPNILLKALLHPSYKARDRKGAADNFEPLDYVGGFVLDYVVSRYILMNSPNKTQHAMSHAKVAVLRQDSLAYFAVKNNFHKYVFLDRPIEKSSLRDFAEGLRNVHTLADLEIRQEEAQSLCTRSSSRWPEPFLWTAASTSRRWTPVFLKMIKRELDQVLNA
uniref:Putative dsrna-specific ribonuclease transcription n=2 Tax=Ixodes ricinus TaxID=34613 RepID=V5GNL1_IXORI